MTIRTRFAPSPTGYLHVGGARTALYTWLYARKHKGVFILRIEDTDLKRSNKDAIQAILDSMNWLGLDYDEEVYYQSKCFGRYQEVIAKLLAEDRAYKCYCSKERLDKIRQEQLHNKQKPRYDGYCRDLKPSHAPDDRPFVVRFKNPQDGAVSFEDCVLGRITVQNSELDDLIIARSDGSPTYNFTVVVDDMDMKISHVIRGADHINNTPRQINIFRALNAPIPRYAHIPMILGDDGKKLSKRHGALGVMEYRDQGFLPEALLNYLVRLGWSHGDQEIFSLAEMIDLFDIKDVNKAAAMFSTNKLRWLNQCYLKTEPRSRVAKELTWHMAQQHINTETGPTLEQIIDAQAERVKTLKEMAEKSRYFYEDINLANCDDKTIKKYLQPEKIPALEAFYTELTNIENWREGEIHQALIDVTTKFDIKLGKLAQPVRVIVTGGTISPPLDETLTLIGKDRSLTRLRQGIEFIKN